MTELNLQKKCEEISSKDLWPLTVDYKVWPSRSIESSYTTEI